MFAIKNLYKTEDSKPSPKNHKKLYLISSSHIIIFSPHGIIVENGSNIYMDKKSHIAIFLSAILYFTLNKFTANYSISRISI